MTHKHRVPILTLGLCDVRHVGELFSNMYSASNPSSWKPRVQAVYRVQGHLGSITSLFKCAGL